MGQEDRKQQQMLEILKHDVPVEELDAGIWYQPRSFWAVQQVTTPGGTSTKRFVFPQNDFRNGTRWPALVKRMAVCAVGYPLARPDVTAMGATAIDNGECLINRAAIQVSVPGRSNYSFGTIAGVNYTPRPTSDPLPLTGASSLYGTSRLGFDKPLIIGENQACEWELATLAGQRWLNPNGAPALPFNLPADPYPATMSYLERGGLLDGDARSVRTLIQTDQSGADMPFPRAPGFGPIAPPGAAVPYWNGISKFNAKQFRAHQVTRQGSSYIYGLNLAIDQIDADDFILDPARFPLATLSQLSTRMGCRARVVDGPNSDWWWRPGAPVALVMDTITPAVVYELPQPIALGPGDTLEVTLSFPSAYPEGEAGLPEDVVPILQAASYQVGIAFNGYAAVEG